MMQCDVSCEQKPLLVKIKLDYVANGAPGSDMADVSFPEGC